MKTLNDFATEAGTETKPKPEPEFNQKYFKPTFKAKMRHLKCSPSKTRTDLDIPYYPNLVSCRSLCSPEDIDMCRSHGVTSCRWRHI